MCREDYSHIAYLLLLVIAFLLDFHVYKLALYLYIYNL